MLPQFRPQSQNTVSRDRPTETATGTTTQHTIKTRPEDEQDVEELCIYTATANTVSYIYIYTCSYTSASFILFAEQTDDENKKEMLSWY